MALREKEGDVAAASHQSEVAPGSGLSGDVRGMIVEDQLDRGVNRTGGVEEFEEFDEFAAAIRGPDQGVNLAADEVSKLTVPCRSTRVRRWRSPWRPTPSDPRRRSLSLGCPLLFDVFHVTLKEFSKLLHGGTERNPEAEFGEIDCWPRPFLEDVHGLLYHLCINGNHTENGHGDFSL